MLETNKNEILIHINRMERCILLRKIKKTNDKLSLTMEEYDRNYINFILGLLLKHLSESRKDESKLLNNK